MVNDCQLRMVVILKCKYKHFTSKIIIWKGYFLLNERYFLDLTNFMWRSDLCVWNIL